MKNLAHTLIQFLCVGLFVSGCATYQGKVGQARRALESGDYESANGILQPLSETPDKDQLVYLLDYATALQVQGHFKESSQKFIQADKVADFQDYTSITNEASSLLFSQEMVQYKGEDFELLLIHVMAAINYTLMGDLESARVETRRLTEKLNYFKTEKKLEYAQNPFMYYLNAHIWEANKDWDSAFIDFKKAYDLGMNNRFIKEDLIRAADRARRNTEKQSFISQFGAPDDGWKNKLNGELILLYQQGWGPRKEPNPEAPRFPVLRPLYCRVDQAQLVVDGQHKVKTEMLYDVESAAIEALDKQYSSLVMKRMAGIVTKEVVSHQVSKKNEAAGAALWILMHASDRADLRQWSTLPKSIQLARMYLPEGKHRIKLQGLDGGSVAEETEEFDVEIKKGRKHFIGWRTFK